MTKDLYSDTNQRLVSLLVSDAFFFPAITSVVIHLSKELTIDEEEEQKIIKPREIGLVRAVAM